MAFKLQSNRKPRAAQAQLAAFADEGEDSSDQEAAALKAQHWKEEGMSHAEHQNYDRALQCLEVALQLTLDDAVLYELRAQVLNEVNRTWEAVQSANKAVELRPDWVEARLTLARAQLNLGEPQLALASLEKVLELQADHPEALAELNNVRMLALMQKRSHPSGGVRVTVQGMKAEAPDQLQH